MGAVHVEPHLFSVGPFRDAVEGVVRPCARGACAPDHSQQLFPLPAQFTGLVRQVVDVHAVVGVRLHQHHGIGSPSQDADGAVDAVVGLFGDQHHVGVGLTNAVAPRVLVQAQPQFALGGQQGHQVAQGSAVTKDASAPLRQPQRLPHLIQEQMLQGRVGGSHLVNGLPVVEQVGQGAQHGFLRKGNRHLVAHVPGVVQLVGAFQHGVNGLLSGS